MFSAVLPLFAILLSAAVAEKFFDPTHDDFKQCGFTRRSLLCDPDGVLSTADRIRLNNDLQTTESRTSLRKRDEIKGDCSRAGITPAIYLVKSGGQEETAQIGAFMKEKWILDSKCENNLIIVFSATETRYQILLNSTHHNSLNQFEVVHFLTREVQNIKSGNFGAALSNVLKKTIQRATSNYSKWTPSTYPNPITGGHGKCGLKAAGPLCDPDGIFDEDERESVLMYLSAFEEGTRHSPVALAHSQISACRDKGYTMGLAVMRNVNGGTLENLHDVTSNMLKTWKLDEPCGKHFVMAISIDDGLLSILAPHGSPLKTESFTKYFENHKSLVLRGELAEALNGILYSAVLDAYSGKLYKLVKRTK